MSRCYRTPMPILTAAHAIGMGLLRPKGMVSGLTTQDDWRNLGYEVEGDFRKEGNFITVRRTAHSHLHMLDSSDLLRFVTHNSRQQELEALVANIKRDIGEDVKASREILVVVVGHPSEAKGLQQSVAEHLHAHSIDYYLPSAPKANTLDLSDWRKQKPDQFWHEGAVTISRIHQAKGNEADVVYLIGLDSVAEREHLPEYRNQVFVALTRTRAWVQVSGVGDYPFFNEFHQVMAAKGEYTFRFKRPDRTLGE
jgi:superfamily I DNA and RNA helicase